MYILKKWIDTSKLDWNTLSSNKKAISLLEKFPEKINWDILSRNKNAIHLHPEKIFTPLKI